MCQKWELSEQELTCIRNDPTLVTMAKMLLSGQEVGGFTAADHFVRTVDWVLENVGEVYIYLWEDQGVCQLFVERPLDSPGWQNGIRKEDGSILRPVAYIRADDLSFIMSTLLVSCRTEELPMPGPEKWYRVVAYVI